MVGRSPRSALSVVLVSPSWPPERAHNGITSYVGALRGGLADAGVDVRVLAAERLDAGDSEGVSCAADERNTTTHYLGNKLRRLADPLGADRRHAAWQTARALRRMNRRQRVDLYEIEESYGYGRQLPRGSMKQVMRLHGPWFLCAPALGVDPEAPEHRARIIAEGVAIAGADAVTAPSAFVLDAVRERYGLALETARVIPNATALPELLWTREHAAPEHVLFVGRFDRLKGADTVLHAFDRLQAKRPEARLTFVGPDRGMPDGTDFDTFARRELTAQAFARVDYLGPQPPSRIAELRRRAEITVVASRFESFGMTVIEAMSQGAPLLATRAGAIPELLDWTGGQLLVEPGSADALADALCRLMDDPNGTSALAARGRTICEERYGIDAVAAATRRFYEGVAGG